METCFGMLVKRTTGKYRALSVKKLERILISPSLIESCWRLRR